jgi:hypothetical protein
LPCTEVNLKKTFDLATSLIEKDIKFTDPQQ